MEKSKKITRRIKSVITAFLSRLEEARERFRLVIHFRPDGETSAEMRPLQAGEPETPLVYVPYGGGRNNPREQGLVSQGDDVEETALSKKKSSASYTVVIEGYEPPHGTVIHSKEPKTFICHRSGGSFQMKRWTEDEWKKTIHLRESGKSFSEIAEELGRSEASVKGKFSYMKRKELLPEALFSERD